MSNFAQYVEPTKFNFVCPDCKHTVLEESCIVASEIDFVMEEEVMYGEQETHDGFINRFQCKNCGYSLKDGDELIITYEELYELSKENGWIIEE